MKKGINLSPKSSENERRLRDLCLEPEESALGRMETTRSGLTDEAAEERMRDVGPNVLAAQKPRSVLIEILERFKNPLVIQLLLIMTVSVAV